VVHFAQLTFGNAMLMLVSVRDTGLNSYIKQPDEIGGAETQSCYLLVSDADAHCARARSSGAEIILDIQDDDFGGRSYACRDSEGHIWNFGTYDPWQGKHPGDLPAQSAVPGRGGMRRWIVVFGLLMTIIASVLVARNMHITLGPGERMLETVAKEAEERAGRAAQDRLTAESNAREDAEHSKRVLLEQLDRERIAKETAERAAKQAGNRIEEERRARYAAENIVREVRQELDRTKDHDRRENEQLDRVRQAQELAERTAEQARQRVAEEQNAKEAAERTAQEMREQLDRAREAKEIAERDAEQARQRASERYSANEATERAANELREQLSRERSAKNAALKTAAQLRRQLSQVQNAKQP
jgi:uncharacterized glyoxalase superfamily protein PhnB